jgi:PAS domain S-box-containing protein
VAKRQVLIVHDDPLVVEQLRERLCRQGHEVTESASRGADLLLIDIASASDDADSLQRRLEIPVLLMVDDGAEPARIAGTHGHLVKPFTDRELDMAIELTLARYHAARTVGELENRFFVIAIDMVCFLGFNGYFKWLNPAWERTLGFTREELMSKPFIEFVHPDDRERTLNKNRDVRGGGQALAFENRYLCKDGSYRWLRWNAAADADHHVIYSVARDVTDSKHADAERDRLVAELTTALAEVKTLREILPICSYCRKIRDDDDYWHTVEGYIARHTTTQFSHGICPSCMETIVEPELQKIERE